MVEIKIIDNGMSAEIKVSPETEEIITVEYIKEMLHLEGVQAGVKEEVINDIVANKDYGRFIGVAAGKVAVNGKDGHYEYHFITEEESKLPRILEDGSVDYSMAFTNVASGDLVAEYFPRTTGTYGHNVYAAMIPPKMGKELRPLRCKGVKFEDNKYYAEKDGMVTMVGNQIVIRDVLDINGDVDQNVGNLDFKGDIHVHGSILSSLSVKAEGSVIVDGVIESANIKAEKDVIVAKGIHGNGVGRVEADGSVSAVFIDHGFVYAGGSVKMDYAVGSLIEARDTVKAEGHYSSIVGGIITGINGVEAGVLGNIAEVSTHVYAGITSKMRADLESLVEQVQELKDDSGMIADDAEFAKQLETIEELRSKILSIESEHKACRMSPIIVQKAIYPGVKCYLSGLQAPNLLGRKGFELRNIRHKVVCRKIGTYSPADIDVTRVYEEIEDEPKVRPRILVIDDDFDTLHTISETLQDNYHVLVARKGSSARKILEKKETDLILVSYSMSDESGVMILRGLKKREVVKDVPVVFLIGAKDKGNIMECLELNPAGYAAKPIESEELLKKLKEILK